MTEPTATGSIVLVGSGNMGSAMLDGWLAHGEAAASICVVEPAADHAAAVAARGIAVVADPALLNAAQAPEIIVLAVKPQIVDSLLPAYAKFTARGAAVLSIAAGKTIAGLVKGLGGEAAVVRAMPNTPASICLGISVMLRQCPCFPGEAGTLRRAAGVCW